MNYEDLSDAVRLAQEFLRRAKKIPKQAEAGITRVPQGKDSASVKRASMDLTAQLAILRRAKYR